MIKSKKEWMANRLDLTIKRQQFEIWDDPLEDKIYSEFDDNNFWNKTPWWIIDRYELPLLHQLIVRKERLGALVHKLGPRCYKYSVSLGWWDKKFETVVDYLEYISSILTASLVEASTCYLRYAKEGKGFNGNLATLFIHASIVLGDSDVLYYPHGALTEDGTGKLWCLYLVDIVAKAIREIEEDCNCKLMHFHDMIQVILRIVEEEDIDLEMCVMEVLQNYINN